MIASQLDTHEHEHCRLSKHPCVFGCGEKIVKMEMDAHIKKASENVSRVTWDAASPVKK